MGSRRLRRRPACVCGVWLRLQSDEEGSTLAGRSGLPPRRGDGVGFHRPRPAPALWLHLIRSSPLLAPSPLLPPSRRQAAAQMQASQQPAGGSGGGAPGSGGLPIPSTSAAMQQIYAQQALQEELGAFWQQMRKEVEEHSDSLADFKTQALPLARIKKACAVGRRRRGVARSGGLRRLGLVVQLWGTRHGRPLALLSAHRPSSPTQLPLRPPLSRS